MHNKVIVLRINSGVYYERNLKPYEEQNGTDGEERRELGKGQIL